MEKNNGKKNYVLNNRISLLVPDLFLEEFLNSIDENKITNLYQIFKLYESKGFLTHEKYLQAMKDIFKDSIKQRIINKYEEYNKSSIIKVNIDIKKIEETIKDLFELYFKRFREVKCILKNDKTVFYLLYYKPDNLINSYNIVCSLVIFFKSRFENKIKLLFDLTDLDEDGYLNENDIKQMITACNFIFCEENDMINTNSSILAQSLSNYKIQDILKEIIYDPGNLYITLEKEKYVDFNTFYKSIKLIKDYKYRIIPYYINLKRCLSNVKKEKVIEINDKYKNDFIKVTSSLFNNKTLGAYKKLKNQKSFSCSYLSTILKPKKMPRINANTSNIDLPNINKSFFSDKNAISKYKKIYNNKTKNTENISKLNNSPNNSSKDAHTKKKSKLMYENDKTLKDLLKESTIIEIKDNKNENNKNAIKNKFYHQNKSDIKYYFEAYFDNIRNIEVEPGLIKFINSENINNNMTINSNENTCKSNNNKTINESKKKHLEKNMSFNFNKEK